jgi:hypothetical protein
LDGQRPLPIDGFFLLRGVPRTLNLDLGNGSFDLL